MRPPTRSEEKERLRVSMRGRLAALDPAAAAASARAATDRLLALPELAAARGLLVCLSFGSEISTQELIPSWRARGGSIFVPRAVRGAPALEACAYPCELDTLRFGLRQPSARVAALADTDVGSAVDAAVVLGLAFDLRGYRLGHGAGYFDRFLARHPALPAIGLAHDLQLLERLPAEAHDVPMRVVVTGSRVVRPPAGAGGSRSG
ncbi:MAG TPA: 5-formyltetrahydrofolate cyclo-ligase [Thermoanaerobaculia bacterium]|nr:5-formyltetrahydrofolate cyclo-ligase [Thermoanaerobaculia bacterium]